MNHLLLASLVGSSHYAAVRDDSLKDEDNAAWVMELPMAERVQWVERIRWIRLVDRLAEKELAIAPPGETGGSSGAEEHQEFERFFAAWRRLKGAGPDDIPRVWEGLEEPLGKILQSIAQQWFQRSQTQMDRLSIQSWDRYVTAIDHYHCHHVQIHTLDDYEVMLDGLAGSFFQILPYLEPQHWDSARHFGVVDQFYNNLRDIYEDAQRGICYFPMETLAEFGVTRQSILDGSCIGTPNYRRLMEFWMGDYLLKLRRQAHGLLLCPDLHPSWQRLRAWCLHRYERIDAVFRQCDFDFRRFSECYWQVVQEDLDHYHALQHHKPLNPQSPQVQEAAPQGEGEIRLGGPLPSTMTMTPAAALAFGLVSDRNEVTRCLVIAQFLKLSPDAVPLSQQLFVYLHQSAFVAHPFPQFSPDIGQHQGGGISLPIQNRVSQRDNGEPVPSCPQIPEAPGVILSQDSKKLAWLKYAWRSFQGDRPWRSWLLSQGRRRAIHHQAGQHSNTPAAIVS